MYRRFKETILVLPGIRGILALFTLLSTWMLTAQMQVFASTGTDAFNKVVGKTVSQSTIITDIRNVAVGVFGILAAAAAGFGMVFIALGGIALIHGGATRKQEGMEKIRNGAIGIVVALAAGTIAALAAWIATMFGA
ncbi:hypothetical protein [Alicyclobacillus herbarius]|uniref:hypothetical protein n=1 Tax=Alicyclobacillus herbarius TaxID=122960 RepID=UPI0004174043|nr:hypothetical protein [Alicyclobacillus herbarius]